VSAIVGFLLDMKLLSSLSQGLGNSKRRWRMEDGKKIEDRRSRIEDGRRIEDRRSRMDDRR
jgi:hypothetical protein